VRVDHSPAPACVRCGEPVERWEPLTAGRAAVLLARACSGCGAVEVRARPATATGRTVRASPGATLLHGLLSNLAEAGRTLLEAARRGLR